MLAGKILKGKYRVERILGRGGTSSVYLCTNLELGNQWALKHVHKQNNYNNVLLAEEEILKKLNHISLPKIIDVFYDESGTYIVESYVEGVTLDKALNKAGRFDEDTVIQWAKQLCEVLIYLHNMKPHPIIYRDMKPSNIIITGDNKAVIVDFGIAREHKGIKTKDTFVAGTGTYAAPEQMTAVGHTDQRTDIYSLGVTLYHLLAGSVPEYNLQSLRSKNKNISPQIEYIVRKCLQKNLEDRYQTAEELRTDLDNIRQLNMQNKKRLAIKRLIISASIILSIAACWGCYAGIVESRKNKSMMIQVEPKSFVLSEDVNMNPKTGGHVNVNLKYNKQYLVEVYAGSGKREVRDGGLKEASFVEPASIAASQDGTLYIIDNFIRRIRPGKVETLYVYPDYIEPKIVRVDPKGGVYIASKEWFSKSEECKAGLYKLDKEKLKTVFEDNGEFYALRDFAFDSKNSMYLIEDDLLNGTNRLIKLSTESGKAEVIMEDINGISGIAVDDKNNVYLSSGEYGVIYRLDNSKKELICMAGVYKQNHFVDGRDNRFFEPGRLIANENNLYVIDRDVVRKLIINQNRVENVETVAGRITDGDIGKLKGDGTDVVLGPGEHKDIAAGPEGDIYITDSASNTVRRIYTRDDNASTKIKAEEVTTLKQKL